MDNKARILNVSRFIGVTVLTIGLIIFLMGMYKSGFTAFAAIGLGTIMGAVFIFLIGLFLVVVEDMEMKRKPHKIAKQ
ncbi:hypothetical protein [Salirhabdus sp. Marseille-P4669]|uniref:hypothetical protein n=1 Tax=Salirhabdus sp. Marseille-P4669 TaxID=2042310 RepID=UPI000C7A02F1|nr:hypothetical protein [Salirhabdus sp. Marseille-P4669]